MQRVGGELGGVSGGGQKAPQLGRHVVGGDAGRLEQRPAGHQLHHGTAGGSRGCAARGLEAGVRHAVSFHPDGDLDQVAARCTTRGPGVRGIGERAAPARRDQVIANPSVRHLSV
jgi:hypothetical protein